MRKVVALGLGMAMLLSSFPIHSAELTGIATVTGTCEYLALAGKNLTRDCVGKIVQSMYDNGRTGFTVVVGEDGVAITMSGMQGGKPDADSQLQAVDRVILNLNIDGVAPSDVSAKGACAYTNPYLGRAIFTCHAVDDSGGSYLLQFRTDGSAPSISEFP